MREINYEYYVSIEVAKLLKEAGFDWEICDGYIVHEDGDVFTTGFQIPYDFNGDNGDLFINHNGHEESLSRPTLTIAQRWLREVKHLEISIYYDPTIKSQPYAYAIHDVEEKFNDIYGIISPITHSYSDGYFYTYEEAQESAIKTALEIILDKGE